MARDKNRRVTERQSEKKGSENLSDKGRKGIEIEGKDK